MATPNYGYEKRQKELAKKRKKEDKLKQKAERKGAGEGGGDAEQTQELLALAQAAAQALGLADCALHAEIRLSSTGPVLMHSAQPSTQDAPAAVISPARRSPRRRRARPPSP